MGLRACEVQKRKKKTRENRQLSSFSLEASFLFGPSFRFLSSSFSFFFSFLVFPHYSPLTFDGRLGQVGGENKRRRRDDQKEKRKKKKKRRKKKERRIGRHSILSDRFKQHEA